MKSKLTIIALSLVFTGSAFAGSNIDNIKESKTFTYGYRTSSVPYSFETKDGKAQGYSIDIGKQIHADFDAKFGVQTSMQGQPVTSSNRIPLVENGTISMEFGSTTITADRAKKVNFMKVDVDIVTAAVLTKNSKKSVFSTIFGTNGVKSITSVESLKFSKAIVVSGSTGENYMRKLNNESNYGITIIPAKDYPEAFLLLEQGRGDSVITDRVLLQGEVAKTKNPSNYKVQDFQIGEPEPIGIMYDKNDAELTAFMKEEEAKLKADGTMWKLYDKWFNGKAGDTNINLHSPITEDKKSAIIAN